MLPDRYESLLLTFHDPKIVDGNIVIGNDEGTQLKMVDSAIFAVATPDRFVNSSVDQLAACLAAHSKYVRSIAAASSEETELLAVESFVAEIQRIDPDSLANAENWWAVIIEQMQHGQL